MHLLVYFLVEDPKAELDCDLYTDQRETSNLHGVADADYLILMIVI